MSQGVTELNVFADVINNDGIMAGTTTGQDFENHAVVIDAENHVRDLGAFDEIWRQRLARFRERGRSADARWLRANRIDDEGRSDRIYAPTRALPSGHSGRAGSRRLLPNSALEPGHAYLLPWAGRAVSLPQALGGHVPARRITALFDG